MKITVIGGGPGGLYFAILHKKRDPSAEVTVSGDWAVETYGGVATFSLKGGGDTFVEQIKGIHVYQRDDDGAWQITHDIWNVDAEPAAME